MKMDKVLEWRLMLHVRAKKNRAFSTSWLTATQKQKSNLKVAYYLHQQQFKIRTKDSKQRFFKGFHYGVALKYFLIWFRVF